MLRIDYIHKQPYMQIRETGVVVAVIDTGIDYLHPAFIYPDNTTKILRIWDQTIEGIPPDGFQLGHEYTAEDINRALRPAKRRTSQYCGTSGYCGAWHVYMPLLRGRPQPPLWLPDARRYFWNGESFEKTIHP